MTLETTAYLCDKKRSIQTKGDQGKLSFDGKSFVFDNKSDGQKIRILVLDIRNVDLNNIMAYSQFIIRTNDGKQYIFSLNKPVSNKESAKMLLTRPYSSYAVGKNITSAVTASKQWREALIKDLPADKVTYRNEVRIKFLIPAIIISVIAVAAAFFLLVLLLAK